MGGVAHRAEASPIQVAAVTGPPLMATSPLAGHPPGQHVSGVPLPQNSMVGPHSYPAPGQVRYAAKGDRYMGHLLFKGLRCGMYCSVLEFEQCRLGALHTGGAIFMTLPFPFPATLLPDDAHTASAHVPAAAAAAAAAPPAAATPAAAAAPPAPAAAPPAPSTGRLRRPAGPAAAGSATGVGVRYGASSAGRSGRRRRPGRSWRGRRTRRGHAVPDRTGRRSCAVPAEQRLPGAGSAGAADGTPVHDAAAAAGARTGNPHLLPAADGVTAGAAAVLLSAGAGTPSWPAAAAAAAATAAAAAAAAVR